MTKYNIHMEQLREHGKSIKKIGSDEIFNSVNEINRLANDIVWEGPARDKFKEVFEQKMQTINYIPTVIETYGKFMTTASGGYDDINDQMYDEYLREANENDAKHGKKNKDQDKYRY